MATGAPFVTVLCVDDSKNAEQAFNYYTSCIHKPDNKLIILHVTVLPAVPALAISAPTSGSVPFEDFKKTMKNIVDESKVIEGRYNSLCNQLGIQHQFDMYHPNGSVGEAIVDQAKKRDANLVVMASRSQTFSRALLGSTSDYVLHHSTIPVLICPEQRQ
uniref:uncharacterized protein LOC120346781 n=1 Tax=Styela clava TaxID=7725 RepID=UPI00193A5FFC|nr:uncharacterized protein LOC120346781 [Styela clava]